MFSSLIKIAVGASLFQIGKAIANRDSVILINGTEVNGDKKEIVGAALSIGGVVMAVSAINRLIK